MRTQKMLAIVLSLQLVGFPITVLAQDPSLCGLLGTCTPNTATTLLGLPQGTLVVRTIQPWDSVVKGSAATAWIPLEAEARVFLSGLHGVPNDDRLPHAAADEIRGWMFGRLMQLADRQAKGQTLTPVEKGALDAFADAVVARRVNAAQQALNEYYRWAANPCGYRVPAGFNFTEYDPGPICGAAGTPLALNVPVRPPTSGQFTAYGAAIANQDFVSADAAAATKRFQQNLAAMLSIGAAAAAAGLAAIVAASSFTVALALAKFIGSAVTAGIVGVATLNATAAFNAAVAAGGVASITGIGAAVAASVVGVVLLALAVTIIGGIEFVEDAQILPKLQQQYSEALQRPSIHSLGQNEQQATWLVAAFIAQTLPDYEAERLSAGPLPPSAPQPGDPVFAVNGVERPVLETRSADGMVRQVFMSGGWFVTRTRKTAADPYGPWQWSLKFRFDPPTGPARVLGIQPGGFLDIDDSGSATPRPASKISSFQPLVLPEATNATVTWEGNHAPVLNATAGGATSVGIPLPLSAGATDPDNDALTIKWYIENPGFFVLNRDFNACDFRPNSPDPAAPKCPWEPFADSGNGISPTFARPGTYGVLVLAKDSKGAISSQRFFVNVNGVAPTLSLVAPAPSVGEGQSVTVSGRLDYPQVGNGQYGTITSLVVDWGDGATTRRDYPCTMDLSLLQTQADFCTITNLLLSGRTGPWDFELSHTYTFSPARAVPPTAAIKVYARTGDNVSTPITTFDVAVSNVVPTFTINDVCRLGPGVICSPGLDIRDVPAGSPLRIGAVVRDVPGATHAIKVFWGDGSSTFLPAGCTEAGCPIRFPMADHNGQEAMIILLEHTYSVPGVYPIQMQSNDGGPGGVVNASANATIFGVAVNGPTSVAAGEPATYTLTPTTPTGLTVTSLTPSCDGGTVTASTASTFTCVFADVPTRTTRAANVLATIAESSVGTGLSVNVLPSRPAIAGPTTVIAGTSATYTYPPPPFPNLFDAPGCSGQVTAFTPGSITCAFGDSQAPYTGTVAVIRSDALTFPAPPTVTQFSVNVVPDLTGPALTLPAATVVPSTTNAGAIVNYPASAVDEVSGPAAVSCSPASGGLFPIGNTTVSCSADDWKGNHATGGFVVTVTDATRPTLSLPAPITVDATAPTGAIVTFSATAADALPASPPVSCLPASGSRFAIGMTRVKCQASDAAGNTATGEFAVTVRGPSEKIQALQNYINGLSIEGSVKTPLLALLKNAASSVAANRPGACAQLTAAANLATAGNNVRTRTLTGDQIQRIVSDIAQIRAVLGCQ